MGQSHWEADSRLVGQDIYRFLWNPKIQNMSTKVVHWNQFTLAHVLKSNLFKTHFYTVKEEFVSLSYSAGNVIMNDE